MATSRRTTSTSAISSGSPRAASSSSCPSPPRGGGLAGVIGLGGKRSELPFSTDDRELLAAVAASAALAVEGMRLRGGTQPPRGPVDEPARECPRCGLVMSSEAMICPECRVPTAEASVPYVLFGKFQFVRQLGAGGMGVVYLATDLALNRRVAVKTLPHMLPRYAMRLQREARAMAAFLHPNLALIFGAESWKGLPLLIEEYLSGGTLSDRLRRRRLSVDEALTLGVTLAGALERLHSGGVLHRDIKPSNIAFDADGTPKLLDFGLASIASERAARSDDDADPTIAETTAVRVESADGTRSGVVLGTPGYLSPEALERRPGDPRVDLWSLTIVLFEAISGTNPFYGRTVAETLDRILHTDVADIRDYAPECPAAVADFFRLALGRNRRRRPSSARELRWQMENLQRVPVPLSA
jgi:serine/threonine protein kinase